MISSWNYDVEPWSQILTEPLRKRLKIESLQDRLENSWLVS
jgi:hypothetical protein